MIRILAIILPLAITFRVSADEVTITESKDSIDFKIGNSVVSQYHFGDAVAKPYLYPLNAPGDIPVTRAWPMVKGAPKESTDHVHQKSAWFCHGDVIPEGIELKHKIKGVKGVDFWSETVGHGNIVLVASTKPKNGMGTASIDTKNEWRTADGVKILDESRSIELRELPTHARLLIFEIDLHASVCPIVFADTKEGSFGVRVNDEIVTKNGGHFFNADGKKDEREIWGNPSSWCDYVGAIGGKTAGIAIFDDPGNKPASCWHARGYGLMAANPFGRNGSFPSQRGKTDLVRLARGEHLKLRYGILLHAGDTKDGKVADAFEAFKKRAP